MLNNILNQMDEVLLKMRYLQRRRLERKEFHKCVSGNSLTYEQKKEIHDFWGRYASIDEIFHEFYYEKTGVFSPKYIPDELWYTYIDAYYNDKNEAKAFDNKCYYDRYFPDVQMPRTVARRINGCWMNQRYERISNIEEYLNSRKDEVFIKEAIESCGGHGVHCYGIDELDKALLFLKSVDTDVIIQETLHQSERIKALNPSSVNTVRVLSLLEDGEVTVLSKILRMGITTARVDNASSGGITCGITNDGYLKKVAYSAKGEKYEIHPFSNIAFEHYAIPAIDDIERLTKQLHPTMGRFGIISWDWAVDESNKPVLIEVNLSNGELDFHQLNNGPLFGNRTEEIMKRVFEKKVICKSSIV